CRHRLITLNNATSITPWYSCFVLAGNELYVGHFWVQFNKWNSSGKTYQPNVYQANQARLL
ncbi:MAG: hypothetical protein QGF90_18560, partial [Gammaproteobacteria bacterium]|nr:hypothetical protein [Gammaproteobacteria bacterium]